MNGGIVVGPGDDCAVVDVGRRDVYQLLKTDSLVEEVHYLEETPPAKVGWKAVARVVSDFAAMGGRPGQLLVTISMPADKPVRYVEGLYRGMKKCADAYGAVICGGETSSVPEGSAAVISVAGTGWVKKGHCVTRGGGQPGDVILVTGKLGGSIRGKHLSFKPRLDEALWLVENFRIRSMMDVSDGLAKDLPRLAAASGCGFQIDGGKVPRNRGCDLTSALGDGEDYELLFTVSGRVMVEMCGEWGENFPNVSLTAIGKLTGGDGALMPCGVGWEHFKA